MRSYCALTVCFFFFRQSKVARLFSVATPTFHCSVTSQVTFQFFFLYLYGNGTKSIFFRGVRNVTF